MTSVYTISSPEDARVLSQRITSLRLQLYAFQAITLRKLANSIILDQIQKRMRDFNFSEKIVTNTIISNIEIKSKTKMTIHFISTLFSDNGFDVALAREKGTKDHMVRPTAKSALRWIQEGVVHFSKGHKVSGMKALHIISDTLDEYEGLLQKQFNDECNEWFRKNLKGVSKNSI